jgi:hypothetical protein
MAKTSSWRRSVMLVERGGRRETYNILMGIKEAFEAVFFALVKDLDEIFEEFYIILATRGGKCPRRSEVGNQ